MVENPNVSSFRLVLWGRNLEFLPISMHFKSTISIWKNIISFIKVFQSKGKIIKLLPFPPNQPKHTYSLKNWDSSTHSRFLKHPCYHLEIWDPIHVVDSFTNCLTISYLHSAHYIQILSSYTNYWTLNQKNAPLRGNNNIRNNLLEMLPLESEL